MSLHFQIKFKIPKKKDTQIQIQKKNFDAKENTIFFWKAQNIH